MPGLPRPSRRPEPVRALHRRPVPVRGGGSGTTHPEQAAGGMSCSDLLESEIVRKRLQATMAFAHEFGSRALRCRLDVSEGKASLPAGDVVTKPRTISACAEVSYHRAWPCRALERRASVVVPASAPVPVGNGTRYFENIVFYWL